MIAFFLNRKASILEIYISWWVIERLCVLLQSQIKIKNKMANVKNLKKDINYVLGDIIEAVYLFEITTTGKPTTETNALIDEAIAAFDALITKVNAKNVENKKAHFKQINVELEQTANQLIAKINELQAKK